MDTCFGCKFLHFVEDLSKGIGWWSCPKDDNPIGVIGGRLGLYILPTRCMDWRYYPP